MQTIRWYRWLATGVLALPVAARAQGPQPIIKELATIPGEGIDEVTLMPNGRVLLVGNEDSLFAFDLATKRSTLVARPWNYRTQLSPRGDRVAYSRRSEDGKYWGIWSIPLDPATGTPRGAAQRVVMDARYALCYSPDGQSIAYWTSHDKQFTLEVVPATGGPARVLMTSDQGIREAFWSSDGRSITARLLRNAQDTIERVVRVSAAGGATETLVTFSVAKGFQGDGLSEGPAVFFGSDRTAKARGRLSFAGPNGIEGEVVIPTGAWSDFENHSPKTLLATYIRHQTLHLLDIGSGTTRVIAAPSIITSSISWSQDGRRLAALLANESLNTHDGVILMNADGSGRRTYPVPGIEGVFISHGSAASSNGGQGTYGLQLSPDGRMVALGIDTPRGRIALLDLATGRVRDLNGPAMTPTGMRWRSDGKAIFVEARIPVAGSIEPHLAVVSMGLDGTSKVLRDVTAEYPDAAVADPSNDQDVLVYGPKMSPRFVVLPLNGGPGIVMTPKPLDTPASAADLKPFDGPWGSRPFQSHDGQWLLQRLRTVEGSVKFAFYTRTGELMREMPTPFTSIRGASSPLPDGKHLFLFATTVTDTVRRYYVVPLDGSAPRSLSLASDATASYMLSPDGKTVVYGGFDSLDTRIDAIDFTPVLRAAGIH